MTVAPLIISKFQTNDNMTVSYDPNQFHYTTPCQSQIPICPTHKPYTA
jgi:hypothetical protein